VGAVRGATGAPRSGAGAPAAGGGTSSGGVKPAPNPGKPAALLEITGTAVSDQAPLVGQEVFFTVNWSDGDGRYFGSGAEWGDQTPGGSAGSIDRCGEVPSPRHGSARMSHTWNNAGTYNVKLSVSTYDCKTYTLETREVIVKITVSDPPPPPTDPPPSSPPPSSPPPASPPTQG
jgi:hypothetical protein